MPETALRLLLAGGLLLLGACEARREPTPAGAPAGAGPAFRETTAEAGIRFRHENDATAGRRLPETLGAGVAVFDADGDGWADLFFVAGGRLASAGSGTKVGALYRNLGPDPAEPDPAGASRFEEIASPAAPLGFYGMGAAVGDVDGDGDLDLFVSGVGRQLLLVNDGHGGFAAAGPASGLAAVDGFGTGSAFLDFDRDGRLDLFLGRYVEWSPATDIACRPDGRQSAYCTPEVYTGQASLLFRNRGLEAGGAVRFEDVSRASGIGEAVGKTLGVVASDLDRDGWPDLAVANDTARNFLFANRGPGATPHYATAGVRFAEIGVEAGFAFSESGATRGGMGIDAADLDGDGLTDLVVGNFAQEMSAVYRGVAAPPGQGLLFVDDAARLGIGLPTLMTLAFGTLVFDYDGDGRLDLLLANGHIEPEISRIRRAQAYAQPLQLFHQSAAGHLDEVPPQSGDPLAATFVGRGLATGDLDRDGDLDVLLTENGRPAHLLANQASGSSWLRLELVAQGLGEAPYGARVIVEAGGLRLERELAGGRSYLSASEPVLTVGLGTARTVERLEIVWPSGRRQVLRDLAVDHTYRLREPDSLQSAPDAARDPS